MPLYALEKQSSAPSFSTPSVPARRAPQWKWNPYKDAALPSLLTSGLTAEERMSIPVLVEKYEQQVAALLKTHEDIMFVKGLVHNALRELRSFAGESAHAPGAQEDEKYTLQLAEGINDVSFIKQGLDIRLRQFDEDCQKASKLEWILRRKLSNPEDTSECLQTVQLFQVRPTCEALKQIQDHDRLIKLVQHVLDQRKYHNYTFAEQLCRMRKECFAEELETLGTIRKKFPPFEGKEIQYNLENGSKLLSSWMKMIRMQPTKEQIPPPPRADPQSLCFLSKVQDIDQLASAVAEGGGKVATFRRERDFKELLGQLFKLRNVLANAVAAAKGAEKTSLNELTTHVDGHISYASRAPAQAGATEGASEEKSTQATPITPPQVDSGQIEGHRSRASTLVEIGEKREAGPQRGSSRSFTQKGPGPLPCSTDHVLSRVSSRTLASPRRSRTTMLNAPTEEPGLSTAAAREDMLTKRKLSLSLASSSPPPVLPLFRGASRTVPSPRQSISEKGASVHGGKMELTRGSKEEYLLSVQPPIGAEQSGRGARGGWHSADLSAQVGGTLTRPGTRTVRSPRETLSRSSLTLCSPREQQTPVTPTPLSRAMSSAFLGG